MLAAALVLIGVCVTVVVEADEVVVLGADVVAGVVLGADVVAGVVVPELLLEEPQG